MEYSESIINSGVTYDHQCPCCGEQKHHVKGVINYAYLMLESLPLFPTARSVKLECSNCLHITDSSDMNHELYRRLLTSSFNVFHFVIKFIGAFLLILSLFYWWQSHESEQAGLERIVEYPAVNDFMLLDHRQLVSDYRPSEKYRIARVVDITGDKVSLVMGNFFYAFTSSFRDAIATNQTAAFNYFGKKHYVFTLAELKQLQLNNGILKAARPVGNFLFGSFVINDTGYRVGSAYIPGEREYASGLAYEQAYYLEDNMFSAFEKMETSAKMGFSLGQIRLAEYYLAGDVVRTDFNQALNWLEKASLQSNEQAVRKYAIVCNQTKNCDLARFYDNLIASGVNLTVNYDYKIKK